MYNSSWTGGWQTWSWEEELHEIIRIDLQLSVPPQLPGYDNEGKVARKETTVPVAKTCTGTFTTVLDCENRGNSSAASLSSWCVHAWCASSHSTHTSRTTDFLWSVPFDDEFVGDRLQNYPCSSRRYCANNHCVGEDHSSASDTDYLFYYGTELLDNRYICLRFLDMIGVRTHGEFPERPTRWLLTSLSVQKYSLLVYIP